MSRTGMEAPATPGGATSGTLRGYVEAFGPRDVWGWVIWTGRQAPRVVVRCGDEDVDVNIHWIPRGDLSAEIAGGQRTPGFQFRVPFDVSSMLAGEPALAESLQVLVDGVPLPFGGAAAPVVPTRAQWTNFPFETTFTLPDQAPVAVQCWSDHAFRIRCRVEKTRLARTDVRLLCDGAVVECPIMVIPEMTPARPGAERELASTVIEFSLPGSIWEKSGSEPACALHFEIAGVSLLKRPLIIDAGDICAWLGKQAADGPHESFDQMLVLEHVHFLAGRVPLDKDVVAYLEKTALAYDLPGYLAFAPEAAARTDARPEARKGLSQGRADIDLAAMLRWQALRDFNQRLPEWKGREDALLESIEDSWPQGAQKLSFVESVTPYFCRIGRFDVVRQKIPVAHLDTLLAADTAWSVSLALPFLVADGQVQRAMQVVYSLAGMSGWINTDCVAEASRLTVEKARVDLSNEKFAYALIELLDKLSADYWSRVQDVRLIEAFACWLDQPEHWNVWLRRDLQRAAMRVYGLCPAFWERMAPKLVAGEPLHAGLAAARERFLRVRDCLSRPALASGELPLQLREDLAFFISAQSRDVGRLLRELVSSCLLAADDVAEVAARLPLQDLLALDEAEVVRLAAMPLAGDVLLPQLPDLPQVLANMQEGVGHSPRYLLQCRLGATLGSLPAMASADRASIDRQVAGLLVKVEAFGDAGNRFLSADILATAWRALQPAGASSMLAGVLSRHIMQGLAAVDDTHWPEQPVLAAIARFRAGMAVSRDLLQRTYLDQVEQRLEQRSASRHDEIVDALAPPNNLVLSADAACDTLVVVYSCRKYLDTRIQALRESWLQDLKARGIPYVILVGDGDDTLNGDLLELSVSDSYEDLPAKSLAMVRWVAENTDFQYLLKIDDDCLLDVDAYFNSLSYRKFHYYGRILRRVPGSMDRRWHQAKSKSAVAQRAVDKSPEPSVYADGGGGYSLSRLAMKQLLAQAATPNGSRLCAISFMEDKLVGDLLSGAGIVVHNEDYYTLVRRRFGDNATPVCVFDNTFAPSLNSPVKLAHLDTPADMQRVRDMRGTASLWPKKIWPSFRAPSLHMNQNQLELLTDAGQVRQLLHEDFFVVAVMRNEQVMLPHFLAHYRKLGAKAFIIVDNLSDDGTREQLLAQPDVVLYSADTKYSKSTYGVAWQQAILANHCLGKWALVADADELIVYPDCETQPITSLLGRLDTGGHDTACVYMIDMYPFGELEDADFSVATDPFTVAPWFDAEPVLEWRLEKGAYSNSANHVSALRHRLLPSGEPHAFTTQKFCLLRYQPWMRLCAGLHNIANANVSPEPVWFAHFKYHAGFKAKVEEEVKRKQHFGDAQEYRKYMSLLTEGRGRFGVEGLSRRYIDSSTFCELLPGRGEA